MHEAQVDSSSPPYDDVQPNQSPTHYSGEGGPSKSESTAINHGQKLRNGERGPSKSESTANNHRQKLRHSHNYKGM